MRKPVIRAADHALDRSAAENLLIHSQWLAKRDFIHGL